MHIHIQWIITFFFIPYICGIFVSEMFYILPPPLAPHGLQLAARKCGQPMIKGWDSGRLCKKHFYDETLFVLYFRVQLRAQPGYRVPVPAPSRREPCRELNPALAWVSTNQRYSILENKRQKIYAKIRVSC